MNLSQNPFTLLGLSLRDNKTTIAEQFEEKVADGEIDEHDLMVARKNLMTSKTRLKAEIAWFPDLNPKKAKEIANLIRCADYKNLQELLPTLNGLSCANLAAYLCSEKRGTKKILSHLFDAQPQIDTTTILNCVNSNRLLTGFPAIDQVMVEDVITEISYIHSKSAMTYIMSANHPGNLFTYIVEKEKYITTPEIASFIDNIAEQYDSWVIVKLRDYEDQIQKNVKKIELGMYPERSTNELIMLLRDWNAYSRPLQLIYQAKGLHEKRTKELSLEMHDVYRLLAAKNDNCYDLALKFVQSLADIFNEPDFLLTNQTVYDI